MVDLYIYYQAAPGDAAALAARVGAMQARLGLGRLKRRQDCADGRITWMEIYEGVDAQFGARLEQAVAAAQLASLIVGSRHTETFVDPALETAPPQATATEAAPCA